MALPLDSRIHLKEDASQGASHTCCAALRGEHSCELRPACGVCGLAENSENIFLSFVKVVVPEVGLSDWNRTISLSPTLGHP